MGLNLQSFDSYLSFPAATSANSVAAVNTLAPVALIGSLECRCLEAWVFAAAVRLSTAASGFDWCSQPMSQSGGAKQQAAGSQNYCLSTT